MVSLRIPGGPPLHPEGITDAALQEAIEFLSRSNPFALHTWSWETGRFIDWRWAGNAAWAPGPEWFTEHGTLFRSPDGPVQAVAIAEHGEDDACILTPSEDPATVSAILEWLASRHHARGDALTFEIAETAGWLHEVCASAGMVAGAPSGYQWEFDLSDVPDRPVPGGFVIRPMYDPADAPGITACLAAAFGGSGGRSLALQAADGNPWYRPDLNFVVEAHDGRIAAYCRGTFDPRNRLGGIHPVCTHPDFSRLGLGAAIVTACFEAQRRLGGDRSYIGSQPDPAPGARLYRSLGPTGRRVFATWTLPAPGPAG